MLRDPSALSQFQKYLASQSNDNIIRFWRECETFRNKTSLDKKAIGNIYFQYIHDGGENQVEVIPENLRNETIDQMKDPSIEIFDHCQEFVFQNMLHNSYKSFIYYLVLRKAENQLSQRKGKRNRQFVGLGDCFCFSDPNLPDNPIVLSSEGFIKVTGYDRSDVIGKNCRFLQGNGTDPESVSRIRSSVKEKKDVTEILLNYKKDSTPFWNLLYICPLYDQEGNLKYFLGGQVDITKNIHTEMAFKNLLSKGGTEKKLPNVINLFNRRDSRAASMFGAEARIVNPSLDVNTQKKNFYRNLFKFFCNGCQFSSFNCSFC